ncbi:MAG TPA: hypothetical protein VMA30_08425 [Xanthobacteraceae bacterium]|nr:hypothetical protein [Xanthobacteraceae bacterium]
MPDEIPSLSQLACPDQVPLQFNLEYQGLVPAIKPDCGLVAGLAEMLHKNAEPATNEQTLGD